MILSPAPAVLTPYHAQPQPVGPGQEETQGDLINEKRV